MARRLKAFDVIREFRRRSGRSQHCENVTKASMLAEFFFALAIGSGMSCVP